MTAQTDRDAAAESSNRALLDVLAPHEIVWSFSTGDVIFSQGEWPTGVHILLNGAVELNFVGPHDPAPLRVDIPGTILGLSSLIGGRVHEYTATAVAPVVTGRVDTRTFFRTVDEEPARWFDVLRILSRDISSCYDRVKEMSIKRPSPSGSALRPRVD